MSPSRVEIPGQYFEALSARSQRASLKTEEGGLLTILVEGESVARKLKLESIQDGRILFFECGRQFIADRDLGPEILAHHTTKPGRFILWLEQFSFKRAVVLSALLLFSIVLYRVLLIGASAVIVDNFPHSWEKEIGENTYAALSETVFAETELSDSTRGRLADRARGLAARMNLQEPPDIFFHSTSLIGPNALAFPGGPVVITDDLVELLDEDGEILAVIAHEFAHIRERHSLKQIIEFIGVTAIVAVLFGADESLIEEASALLIDVWSFRNSRDFEREADLIALEAIESEGIDRLSLYSAMRKLIEYSCGQSSLPLDFEDCLERGRNFEWLSTHPPYRERLEYLSGN